MSRRSSRAATRSAPERLSARQLPNGKAVIQAGSTTTARRPSTKRLLLDLLLAMDPQPLPARHAVAACALFDIRESSARVMLTRLAAAGLIESAERGRYRLSPPAHQLAAEVATWRRMNQRLRTWSGDLVAIHSGALGRSDRPALRRRERAMAMLGFREYRRGLHLRPDNIEADVTTIRQRLQILGLEAEAPVFVARDFDAATAQQLPALWDVAALDQGYRETAAQLDAWMAQHEKLSLETAARESFLLGGEAIRLLVFDPLLPEAMVDGTARGKLLASTLRFDALGQAIWQRLYARHGSDTDRVA